MLSVCPQAKHSGFSLIELMIGILIFSIVLTMGFTSYQSWMQNTQIRNAAESIQGGLQRARAEAVRRNTNVAFVLGNNTSWAVATGVPVTAANTLDSRASSEGSKNVTRTTTPAAATMVTYSNLGRLADNADGSDPITQIALTSATLATARNLQIDISTMGHAKMCNPGLDAGAIGACPP